MHPPARAGACAARAASTGEPMLTATSIEFTPSTAGERLESQRLCPSRGTTASRASRAAVSSKQPTDGSGARAWTTPVDRWQWSSPGNGRRARGNGSTAGIPDERASTAACDVGQRHAPQCDESRPTVSAGVVPARSRRPALCLVPGGECAGAVRVPAVQRSRRSAALAAGTRHRARPHCWPSVGSHHAGLGQPTGSHSRIDSRVGPRSASSLRNNRLGVEDLGLVPGCAIPVSR